MGTLLEGFIPVAEHRAVYSAVCESKQRCFEHFMYVPCEGGLKTISGLLAVQWVEFERVWDVVFIGIENVEMCLHYAPQQVQEHLKSMVPQSHLDSSRPSITTSQ